MRRGRGGDRRERDQRKEEQAGPPAPIPRSVMPEAVVPPAAAAPTTRPEHVPMATVPAVPRRPSAMARDGAMTSRVAGPLRAGCRRPRRGCTPRGGGPSGAGARRTHAFHPGILRRRACCPGTIGDGLRSSHTCADHETDGGLPHENQEVPTFHVDLRPFIAQCSGRSPAVRSPEAARTRGSSRREPGFSTPGISRRTPAVRRRWFG